MAEGFASGFQQGFGLINDIAKRKAEEDYNKERLALAERERMDAAAYRDRLAGIQETQANTAAGTLALNTRKYDDEQALLDPETGLNPLQAQQLEESKARQAQAVAGQELTALGKENELLKNQMISDERDAQNRNIARQEAAVAVSDVYTKLQNRSLNGLPMDESFIQEIENLVKKTEGQGVFDISNLFKFYQEQGAKEIFNMVQEFQSNPGQAFDLTPQRASAIEASLGLNKSAAIGKTIDETFVNAPKWMRNGEWTVESIGLDSVSLGQDQKLNGQLYVVAKDSKGNRVPYLAPLTEGRSAFQKSNVNLDFGEVMQGMAGYQHMVQNIMPVLEAPVQEYVQTKKYGGVDKFEAEVDKRMTRLQDLINSGGNLPGGVVLPGEDPNQLFTDPSMTMKLRKRISRQMMFGESTTSRMDIDDWVDRERSSMMQAEPVRHFRVRNQGDGRRRSAARTFGEQFPELASGSDPEQSRRRIMTLSGYFDQNGEITDHKGLIRALMDLGLIRD